jgi:hypothetical protein
MLYLPFLIVWLIAMLFPVVAFFLATQGEIRLGSEEGSHLRLNLIQEEENQGVGLDWTRQVGQDGECTQSKVYYFLWQGTGETVSFCLCHDPETGETLSAARGSCAIP